MTPADRPLPALTLGAVQLGMPYGLGAAAAGIDEAAARGILDAAWAAGFTAIDTARAYGDSEARIGRWAASRRSEQRPILASKFPRLGADAPAEELRGHIASSLAALQTTRIDYYLAHRGVDLLLPGVRDALAEFVAAGRIGTYGASVYDDADAERLLNLPGLGALQVPMNAATAERRPALDRARSAGVRIFARSVFIQGLLLQDPQRLPRHLGAAAPALRALRATAREADASLVALLLAAVRRGKPDTIVVGIDSAAQARELAAALTDPPDDAAIDAAIRATRSLPEDLADPRRWPKA